MENFKDSPLVSIILPTKNSAKFIGQCLESIKDQTYKNLEIIIVDNYSTDRTKEIAETFKQSTFIKLNKFYNFQIFTCGPERSAQRNFGAIRCLGDYVIFVDSDMKLSENVVFSCIEKIKKDESIKGIIIPEESFGIGFWAQCKKLEKSFYVGVDWIEAARFFEKKAFQEVGGYDDNMTSGEDWDLSQRFGVNHKIARVSASIYHNEGDISLHETIRKKLYYSRKFGKYSEKKENQNKAKKQTSIVDRYQLYFSDLKKLFSNPAIGIGMLFMKTCEFGIGGAGYLICKMKR